MQHVLPWPFSWVGGDLAGARKPENRLGWCLEGTNSFCLSVRRRRARARARAASPPAFLQQKQLSSLLSLLPERSFLPSGPLEGADPQMPRRLLSLSAVTLSHSWSPGGSCPRTHRSCDTNVTAEEKVTFAPDDGAFGGNGGFNP